MTMEHPQDQVSVLDGNVKPAPEPAQQTFPFAALLSGRRVSAGI